MGKKIILLIICLVLIFACGPDKEKMVQEEKKSLDSITRQISNDFLIIKNSLKALAEHITMLYINQDQYDYESHREKYGLSPRVCYIKLKMTGGRPYLSPASFLWTTGSSGLLPLPPP